MERIGGVDIGGTKVRWIVLERLRIVASHEFKTPRRKARFAAALSGVFSGLERMGVRRVGVGFPGEIRGTKVAFAHNLPLLRGIDFRAFAPRNLAVARVENDARCFALVEAKRGAGKGARRLLALIFGTGVGRAFVRNEKVSSSARLSRAERWEGAYQKRLSSPPPALAGFLAKELLPLIAGLSPDAIVIGGGLLRKPRMFTLIRREMRRQGIAVPVRRSRFRENGPAIGAALSAEG